MNRRAFLGAVSAAVGALAFDPERLLWVPGRKSYFDIVRPEVSIFDGLRVGDIFTIEGIWAPNGASVARIGHVYGRRLQELRVTQDVYPHGAVGISARPTVLV